jgi:drug/metabolite transporter (DMT)-like permease
LGEKIGPKRVIGIAVSLLGALIIIRPGSGVFTIYALFPIAAAVCYSSYNLATRFVGVDESPWTSLFYAALFGAFCYSIYIIFNWVPMTKKRNFFNCSNRFNRHHRTPHVNKVTFTG